VVPVPLAEPVETEVIQRLDHCLLHLAVAVALAVLFPLRRLVGVVAVALLARGVLALQLEELEVFQQIQLDQEYTAKESPVP